jgi:hypothetical protein
MTAEEFKTYFKKVAKSEDNSAYFGCVTLIVISVYSGYIWAVHDKELPLVIFALLLVCLGIYGIGRTKNRHIVKEIKSTVSIQRKIEILEGFADTFNKRRLSIEDDIYIIDALSVYIYAYFDDETILLYVSFPPMPGRQLFQASSLPMLKKVHQHFLEHL